MADLSKKEIDALTDAIRNLTKQMTRGSSASATTPPSTRSKSAKDDKSANYDFIKNASKTLNSLTEAAKNVSKSLELITDNVDTLHRSLSDTEKQNRKARKSKKHAEDAAEALDIFSKSLSRQDLSKIIAKASQQSAQGISSGASDSISDARTQLMNLSKHLGEMGLLGEEFTKRFGNVKYLSTRDIPEFSKALQKAMESANLYATHSVKAAQSYLKLRGPVTKVGDIFTAITQNSAFEGLKEINNQLQAFNVAGVADSFVHVNEMSVRMGMSFADTVKLMKSNNTLLAQLGPQGFQQQMSQIKGTFEKFGYTMEQGASIIGPSIDAGISAGIDVSGTGLNKFITSSMQAFSRVRGITDVTAEEFMKLNQQLFSSEETFQTLMGMDKERRFAYQQELLQAREKFQLEGYSIQQANEMLMIQQRASREKVTERNKNAAMMMMRAQMAGLSPQEAMRAYVLGRKGQLGEGEAAELADIQGRTGRGLQERRQAEADITGGFTDISDRLMEATALGGARAEGEKLGLKGQAAKDAQQGKTEEQRAQSAELAKGNENLAKFGNTVNQVSSFLNNEFLGSLKKIVQGIDGVLMSTISGMAGGIAGGVAGGVAGGAARGMAGKALGPLLGRAAPGVLAAAPSLAPAATAAAAPATIATAATAATAAAVTAAVATTATAAYSIYKASKGEDASNWISQMTDKLGVGTGVGNAIGFFTGQNKKESEIMKSLLAPSEMPVKPIAPKTASITPPQSADGSEPKTVNNTTSLGLNPNGKDSIIMVRDELAIEKLQLLAENMIAIADYLKKFHDGDFDKNKQISIGTDNIISTPRITSTTSYLTGRY